MMLIIHSFILLLLFLYQHCYSGVIPTFSPLSLRWNSSRCQYSNVHSRPIHIIIILEFIILGAWGHRCLFVLPSFTGHSKASLCSGGFNNTILITVFLQLLRFFQIAAVFYMRCFFEYSQVIRKFHRPFFTRTSFLIHRAVEYIFLLFKFFFPHFFESIFLSAPEVQLLEHARVVSTPFDCGFPPE